RAATEPLQLFDIGHHDAAGQDDLGRLLDRHRQEHDARPRHEADESRGRHDPGRHEHGQQVAFAAWPRVLDLTRRLARNAHEAPDTFAWELDHPDLLETLVRTGGRDHAFEYLFDRAIDVAHNGRARHHQLSRRHE